MTRICLFTCIFVHAPSLRYCKMHHFGGVLRVCCFPKLSYHNMGVHLAQHSVSGLRYPMGATIGCGLQGAQAFRSAKNAQTGLKTQPRLSATCHMVPIPVRLFVSNSNNPHMRTEKWRKGVEALLKNQQAKAERKTNRVLFKVTLRFVRQNARKLPK